MKQLTITSDDYGISPEINSAIIQLIIKNKLTKVSVMYGDFVIPDTRINISNVLTGLHIDFIYRSIYSANKKIVSISPFKLFLNCYFSRNFDKLKYYQHIKIQADFIKSKGFKINYIDTHLHVHILPKILDILISFAKQNSIEDIRCITMRFKYFPKYIYLLIKNGFTSQVFKIILLYFFGFFMKKKLVKNNISFSKNLVLMPFAGKGNFNELLYQLLNLFNDDFVEFVTHPGEIQQKPFDEYNEGRNIEYNSLTNLNIMI